MGKSRESEQKMISVVVPVYNEQEGIQAFYERAIKVLESLDAYQYELIFVNDGSNDESLFLLLQFAENNPNVKLINLSKNFGHQLAVTAGLDNTVGNAVVIIDADLQDPPEVIIDLLGEWEKGFDVVNAKRRSRKDTAFKRFTAYAFYKFLNLLLKGKIPENVGDFRLLDQKVVHILNQMREKDRYLRGLTTWVGFKQGFVEFDRDERFAGETHYPFRKMLSLALNAIFSFSTLPLKLAVVIGALFILIALAIFVYVIAVYINGQYVPGWTSQIIVLLGFGSIELFVLAIMSEYIARIYNHVQGRPLYIISEKVNFDKQITK